MEDQTHYGFKSKYHFQSYRKLNRLGKDFEVGELDDIDDSRNLKRMKLKDLSISLDSLIGDLKNVIK
jgi:hypothetical protein